MSIVSVLLFSSYIIPVFAITLETSSLSYGSADRMFLKGTIDPENKFYEPVILNVFNNGEKIIQMQSDIVENSFTALITGTRGSFDPGFYSVEASHSSTTETASVLIAVVERDNSSGDYP